MLANTYSPEWFAFFLHGVSTEQTTREVAFLAEHLEPRSRVLDLPCGAGRHAVRLASRGHTLVGVDLDPAALAHARKLDSSVAWVRADMRRLPFVPGSFDAILCLWQSFGYFGAGENAAVLREWAQLVRPGGVLVLDLYHRAFFEQHQGERRFVRAGQPVRERAQMRGNRLAVELLYESTGGRDCFDWQLFTPEELRHLARSCGWEVRLTCSGFDAERPPRESLPRVQYVLERCPDPAA